VDENDWFAMIHDADRNNKKISVKSGDYFTSGFFPLSLKIAENVPSLTFDNL
jgi:hypothetical protein